MQLLRSLYRHTLNSVLFGVFLMLLVAMYIAFGSGFPAVREFFEMNELQFFNAWPLKVLMLLLCLNLINVTWNRIPFTPPRYGVWCIHAGIITLVVGTALYYHLKIEGRTKIPLKSTATVFYDNVERSLYLRVPGRQAIGVHPMPSLPRFKTYAPELHNADVLDRPDLRHVQLVDLFNDKHNESQSLAQMLGSRDDLSIDVLGYYPYAETFHDVADDPDNSATSIVLRIGEVHNGSDLVELISDANPATRRTVLGGIEFEHRSVDDATIAGVLSAADHLMSVDVTIGGRTQTVPIQMGGVYPIGDTGYILTVTDFNPAFPMFGTHEIVKSLTVKVTSAAPAPQREFWRMVLEGKDVQTDFKMDPATTPPMVKGNRQKEPIDKDLTITVHSGNVPDDMKGFLASPDSPAQERHTFLTAGDNMLVDVHASNNAILAIQPMAGGKGMLQLTAGSDTFPMQIERRTHVKLADDVLPVPTARRNSDEGAAGVRQVLLVKISAGSWSETVPVPFCESPLPAKSNETNELVDVDPWMGPTVKIPGAAAPLQLVLGDSYLPLPADLTLEKFELVHYPGGTGSAGPFRDFISTLRIEDRDAGTWSVETAHLNNPVYFGGGNWLFFQHSYDPAGRFTVIGVGSRPAVTIMLVGCVMIAVGLLYAFYAKPLVIRAMKRRAIAEAQAKAAAKKAGKMPAAPADAPVPDLVTSK